MVIVEKNGVRHSVDEGPQLDAFLSSGWSVAEDSEKPTELAAEEVKATRRRQRK